MLLDEKKGRLDTSLTLSDARRRPLTPAPMHAIAARIVENARKNHSLLVPLLYAGSAAIAQAYAPDQHQLLVASVSWAIACIPALFWAGLKVSNEGKRRAAWLTGGFLALSQICDSAACDREGIWSTKGLLPLLVTLLSENELLSKYAVLPTRATTTESPSDTPGPEGRTPTRSFWLIGTTIASASVVLSTRFNTSATTALGISSIIFAATGLALLSSILKFCRDDALLGKSGPASGKSTPRSPTTTGAQREQKFAVLRDVAGVMVVVCGVASWLMEPRITRYAISWQSVLRELPWSPGGWKVLHYHRTIQQVLWMICVNAIVHVLTFVLVSQQGPLHTSFLTVFACICARLRLAPSLPGIWFTVIYSASSLLLLSNTSSSLVDIRSSLRFRRMIFGITAFSICFALLRNVSGPSNSLLLSSNQGTPRLQTSHPKAPLDPITMDLKNGHPASQMIRTAEKNFETLIKTQSKSLGEAVQNYRLRNGIAPPPHFDKWYEFATRNEVVLIDEFDTITQALLPYWALKPSTIRARIKYALGHEDSALMGMMIRDGAVVKIEGGPDWQQQATTKMLDSFIKYLPDMDLGFNIHDEPRVVVPNDLLSAMVAKARDEVLPAVGKNRSPRNSFSSRPADMNDGKRFDESPNTRFNRFAHQQTWTHARLSCPADTQAQQFEDQVPDNLTSYAASPLGYVYNQTAFSDICNSPSLSSTFGFFERPNAFNIIHELTPVFSQSKISTFQDILFPSPWYWFGKVGYSDDRDTTWENKTNSLYWRGSTTGGFSRNGGWRRQHRQRVVRRLNAPDKASLIVLSKSSSPVDTSPNPAFTLETVERRDYDPLVDVKFSHIGQCDPGDCDAQNEFFKVTERVDGQDAWYYKHLLDMDGNAFSGRFYSFMKSRSLVYKMAIFREWHQEWLRPWVHYIPFSLIGDEHLDLVHWFSGSEPPKKTGAKGKKGDNKGGNGDSEGERKAREIAERSRDWAGKVLRNVDFEAWLFRLLLEYGRVIDDSRDNIGYPGV
ncbi:hypothetical protein CC80DRAFT_524453 [Byssothecium circinans]|uniref:Glycosyl transferase CAP10 domain-containing protein n=1 Tax=Byssothecium circinans TaxID=147558 RepID=A0A6A5U382_9PLEO|nr:hypothetical protein CC80DRAFT_524453 [Byssothecium circinans]